MNDGWSKYIDESNSSGVSAGSAKCLILAYNERAISVGISQLNFGFSTDFCQQFDNAIDSLIPHFGFIHEGQYLAYNTTNIYDEIGEYRIDSRIDRNTPEWDNTVSYYSWITNIVQYNGKFYRSKKQSGMVVILNKNPETETDYWQQISGYLGVNKFNAKWFNQIIKVLNKLSTYIDWNPVYATSGTIAYDPVNSISYPTLREAIDASILRAKSNIIASTNSSLLPTHTTNTGLASPGYRAWSTSTILNVALKAGDVQKYSTTQTVTILYGSVKYTNTPNQFPAYSMGNSGLSVYGGVLFNAINVSINSSGWYNLPAIAGENSNNFPDNPSFHPGVIGYGLKFYVLYKSNFKFIAGS